MTTKTQAAVNDAQRKRDIDAQRKRRQSLRDPLCQRADVARKLVLRGEAEPWDALAAVVWPKVNYSGG